MQTDSTQRQNVNVNWGYKPVIFTDLEICDEGNTMVHSHSADEEVVLQVTSVVIGQVDHQVNMTLIDQSMKTGKKIWWVDLNYLKVLDAELSTDVQNFKINQWIMQKMIWIYSRPTLYAHTVLFVLNVDGGSALLMCWQHDQTVQNSSEFVLKFYCILKSNYVSQSLFFAVLVAFFLRSSPYSFRVPSIGLIFVITKWCLTCTYKCCFCSSKCCSLKFYNSTE